ncbi:neprilysin-1 [Drosophila tropicalis]|uniref:neprilysin-1 n=1 Tax=Drosophila tropicalis TaxID=46794 RepID=UPI0035ABADDB
MRRMKSAEMQSYMDSSVQPCEDFYQYACGNYGSVSPATSESDRNLHQSLYAGYLRRVKQLLDEPKLSTDRPMETCIKYFHESCLNTTSRLDQRAHLLKVLKEFGGMPALEGSNWRETEFDAISMMGKLLRRYGKITLLGVEVGPDFINSQINRLYLGQRKDLINIKDESAYLIREVLLRQRFLDILGLSAELAGKIAREIIEVEKELARGILDQQVERDPRARNRLAMLDALTETYGTSLNLTQFARIWLGYEYKLPVYEHVASYLWQLKKVLSTTPKRVLANYMLSSLLEDFEVSKSQDFCVRQTAHLLPDVVDRLVYHQLEQRNPHIPGSLRALWKELKSVFEDVLRQSAMDWLEAETRTGMLDKLKDMSFQIAGAEPVDFDLRYGSLIVSSADYFGNVQRLLALRALNLRENLQRPWNHNYYDYQIRSPIYMTEVNLVILPASYLQRFYFWHEVYPTALNYATWGFSLAHEIAHGFDDLNRMYDGKGNLRDWWTSAAVKEFDSRKECLKEQYSELRYNGAKLPRLETQGETIADNVGIRIAHMAYSKWLEQATLAKTMDTESLPELLQTPQQLFFLGLAQTMCTDILAERRQSRVISNVHPPEELRVFAIMVNSEEFAQAFECTSESKMNPQRKCVIY